MHKMLYSLACLILIIGALNWLFIGLGFGNPVESVFGYHSRIVYIIVGLAGLFMVFHKISMKSMPMIKMSSGRRR